MEIRAGYDIAYQCLQDTPMALTLSVRTSPGPRSPQRTQDTASRPDVPSRDYVDMFGNTCTRIVAPAGLIAAAQPLSDCTIAACRTKSRPSARQLEVVHDLPDDVLVYLLGSRYCDTQKLLPLAWSLFGGVTPGWQRVQSICDYVHDRICFGYQHARCDRTASEGHEERVGVCRDFAHLAVTLCRCMNIPARYCTGYLGDIGVPIDPAPMDFSAWFEVYLGRAVVHLRRASQPSAHRPDRHGTRTGCCRRRYFYELWGCTVGEIYGYHRRIL